MVFHPELCHLLGLVSHPSAEFPNERAVWEGREREREKEREGEREREREAIWLDSLGQMSALSSVNCFLGSGPIWQFWLLTACYSLRGSYQTSGNTRNEGIFYTPYTLLERQLPSGLCLRWHYIFHTHTGSSVQCWLFAAHNPQNPFSWLTLLRPQGNTSLYPCPMPLKQKVSELMKIWGLYLSQCQRQTLLPNVRRPGAMEGLTWEKIQI